MAAKKILLVEDDTNLREIYGARLQAEGYDIVSAPDGENALAIAVKEKPDLIISDVMMPKVSGFDMLDILRNAPETKDTKIIMMTALSQAEDKARADKLGADMYLVKSQVTLEDVTKAVHQILDDPSDSAQEADSAAAQKMVSNPDKKPEEEKPPETKPEQPEAPAAEPAQPTPAPAAEPVAPPTEVSEPQPVQAPPATDTPAQPQPPQEPAKPAEDQPKPETPAVDAPVVSQPTASDTLAVQNPAPTVAPDDKPAATSTSIPVSTVSDDSKASDDSSATPTNNVEPSLAQALADEEKAVQDKIDNFEKTDQEKPTDNPAPAQPAVQEQPPAEQAVPSDDKDNKSDGLLDDKPSKKVIEPINDPTKTPDINELVAQEEAKEASASTPIDAGQAGGVIKPQNPESNVSGTSQSDPDHHDDLGKISL